MPDQLYLYRYVCQRWWGATSNIQLAQLAESSDPASHLLQHAETITGSKTCHVDLLQKFEISMRVTKTYAAMATLPVSVPEQ
jgi:hypothetical protein